MWNKKTNIKTTPFLSPFPCPASLPHSQLLFPPEQHKRNGKLWSVNSNYSLSLFPLLTFPLLWYGFPTACNPSWKKKSWLLHRLLFLSGKLLQHGLSTSYRAVSAPALWTINSSSSLSDLHVPSATSHYFCSFLLSLSSIFCSFLNIFSLRWSLCCFTYSTPPPNENMKYEMNMKIFFTDILKHRFSHIFLQVI